MARRSEEAPLLERSEGNRQPESREVVSRPDNETRVHPRTREIIVTERGAFSRPARAVENWAPAAAERTVKKARRAFGGWNASYTVVEPR